MNRIKFGTDGWRAVIARDYTVENVARVSLASANWLARKYREATVVIGYDTRFGGNMFAETAAKIFGSKGINVILSDRYTSTPVISYVVHMLKAEMGVMITASHNSANYNGYKLKSGHGGPMLEEDVKDIENMIDYENQLDLDLIRLEKLVQNDILTVGNIEEYYIQYVRENFDSELLNKEPGALAFDPMYGSGQSILNKIIPGAKAIHRQYDVLFNNTPPEPLEKNLGEFLQFVKEDPKIKMGLAVDGDADRIALVDADGIYVDSHHILLLLTHYLAGYKKLKGPIVTGFSSTIKLEKLAGHYQLPIKRVKIGFKEISRYMMHEDILVGGEESGGIGIRGHIPERDGIWMGLTIWQWLMETGKSLRELIDEIYRITGKFAFQRLDLQVDKDRKNAILNRCMRGQLDGMSSKRVIRTETLDGFKFFFDENSWLMIRPSGTEPLLRTYSEAGTADEAADILERAREWILRS